MNMATSSGQQKMTISDLEAKWKDVPDKYLITIAHILAGHVNETEEFDRFNGPMLKGSIKSVYWIFLIQYALLAILGIAMNVAIVVYILYHRLYKDVTQAFICNLALCHFVQCAIVLPITLMVMLIQNWIFGQFLCFFLPMLQDIPLHVALISHILIAWDRMRWLGDPLKGRLPAFVCCCATWLTGMVIALPYPIYTIYVEIGDFVPRLSGIGLCVINLMDDMHEYMRGLFLIMYCAPSVLLAYLYIRTSQELREPDGSFSNTMFEHQANLRRSQRNSSNASAERPYGGTLITTANLTNSGNGASLTTLTNANGHTQTGGLSNRPTTRAYDLYSAELDFCREKRNQRNFGTMAATQVLCLCPLMILRMARLSMEETYENQKHFDFMYLMFVWIAFLPTIIFPAIFATQMLPREEQERLRGYFRLSTKRLQKSRSKESGASSSSESTNARQIGTVGSSLHKDVFKNTTLARASFETHNEANAYRCTEPENKLKIQQQQQQQHYGNCESRTRKDYLRHATQTVGAEKDKHVDKFDKADVKIKIISEARSRGSSIASETTSERKKSNGSTIQKLTLETCDNNSFSNMTASTYCNGNSSLLDDGGLSNFGDGEDSSIVSGMIVNSNNYNVTNYSRRPSVLARQKDESVSEVSSLARLNSSTTLERDLEIMDMLEHKRNSDVMEREERHTERRRLPDIEKICQRLPKMNLFDSSTDTSLTAAVASTAQMLSTANVTVNNDPLTTDEAYSSATTSNSPMSFSDDGPMVTDEEVPQDFFDDYKPGSEGPKFPEEVSQYQYTRRHSRHKTPHFGCPTLNLHRNSKRDSFNSLHGNDLIAGAFGELDPTQPLTKMSVIESRMRRSSGRSANFSTNARSSLRSRDLSSTHTMHPELDFRENIFAEL